MIYAITFGDDSFYNSAKLNLWTATHIGKADAAKMYRPEDIDSAYREAHKDIFDQKRGAGYWLWKPYVILDALESLQWNDYLMYVDAGVLYYSSVRPLAEQLERDGQDIYFSAGFWRNEYWTKRDTYVLLNCDDESFYSAHRVAAGYMMIKKTPLSVEFIKVWKRYMEDARLATDMPSCCGKPELPRFREHRHDESVLSLLIKQHGYCPYRSIDGRWEIKRFEHFFSDPQSFYGITGEECEEMYRSFMALPMNQVPYRRVVVNTNIHGRSGLGFWLRVARRVLQAWWWDHTPYKWKGAVK